MQPSEPRRPSRHHTSGLVHRRQAKLHPGDLPLGWCIDRTQSLGFAEAPPTRDRLVTAYEGDGHVATIARTGAGKGRGCTIPWLLQMQNPAIVLDVKGEAYHCTAHWRRDELGHKIFVIDPFGAVGGTDRLNPFDLIRPEHVEEDADVLTELFLDGQQSTIKGDPFWDNLARAFLLGAVAHVATTDAKASPRALRDVLQQDDVTYAIAVLLDNKKVTSDLAKREFVTFINHEKEKVRTSVLSTAQQHMRTVASEACLRTLEQSTISLDDVVRGESFTIYLVIPPEYLASHGRLLRLWIGTLLQCVTRRKQCPSLPTLFLLDEIAQCGTLPILRQAMTLLRGYGLTTITLWQDLSQMQKLYDDWRTLLNNCAVVQTFGTSTWEMGKALGEVLGVAPEQLRDMPGNHSMVSIPGAQPFQLRRFDYLTDRLLRARSSPNPWFSAPSKRDKVARKGGAGR